MTSLLNSEFTKYSFSEREVLDACVLNPLLIQYIQTQKAQLAEQLLDLKFEPGHELSFAQEQAFLQGQLSVYRTMLDASAEAYSTLTELARAEASSQFE